MKRRNIALTLMASFCFSGAVGLSETHADNPFERLIPRGKLLKKLKDEITGEEKQKIITVDPRRPLQARSNMAPTPAIGTGYAPSVTQQREPGRMMSQPHPPTMTRPLPPMSAGTGNLTTASTVEPTQGRGTGFGMMVKNSEDGQFIVTAVQPNGNAARVGMRSGDRLLSVGGGKLTGVDELKQIATTLGQGDQVEVEYMSGGKKRKSLLQFGSAPQEGQLVTSNGNTTGMIESAGMDTSMLSVLDSPVEHISRLEPIVTTPAKASSGKITSLNETIEQQQLKMQAMNEELKLLRKAHQPAVEPTENNWSFPDLGSLGTE